MALALGVKEYDRVYIGRTQLTVTETRGFEFARIAVCDHPYDQPRFFEITDKKATEILPTVFVSCGRPDQRFIEKHEKLAREYERALTRSRELNIAGPLPANPGKLLPRLIFEAPRSITILRAELYERAKAPA